MPDGALTPAAERILVTRRYLVRAFAAERDRVERRFEWLKSELAAAPDAIDAKALDAIRAEIDALAAAVADAPGVFAAIADKARGDAVTAAERMILDARAADLSMILDRAKTLDGLVREAEARLAEIRDGEPGERGEPGAPGPPPDEAAIRAAAAPILEGFWSEARKDLGAELSRVASEWVASAAPDLKGEPGAPGEPGPPPDEAAILAAAEPVLERIWDDTRAALGDELDRKAAEWVAAAAEDWKGEDGEQGPAGPPPDEDAIREAVAPVLATLQSLADDTAKLLDDMNLRVAAIRNGEKGDPGAPGARGDQGDEGPQGPPGPPPDEDAIRAAVAPALESIRADLIGIVEARLGEMGAAHDEMRAAHDEKMAAFDAAIAEVREAAARAEKAAANVKDGPPGPPGEPGAPGPEGRPGRDRPISDARRWRDGMEVRKGDLVLEAGGVWQAKHGTTEPPSAAPDDYGIFLGSTQLAGDYRFDAETGLVLELTFTTPGAAPRVLEVPLLRVCGVYDKAAQYSMGDLVLFRHGLHMATGSPPPGQSPSVAEAPWTLVLDTQRGMRGIKGPPGERGLGVKDIIAGTVEGERVFVFRMTNGSERAVLASDLDLPIIPAPPSEGED